jgi:hypothetical protein
LFRSIARVADRERRRKQNAAERAAFARVLAAGGEGRFGVAGS